jgi:hypothetical protein
VNDLDNCIKDIFDARQGRAGGANSKRAVQTIIPNDNQILRLETEKTQPSKQARSRGHVIVRKLRSDAGRV